MPCLPCARNAKFCMSANTQILVLALFHKFAVPHLVFQSFLCIWDVPYFTCHHCHPFSAILSPLSWGCGLSTHALLPGPLSWGYGLSTHALLPYIGRNKLSDDQQEYNDVQGFYRARVGHLFALFCHWKIIRNRWMGSARDLHSMSVFCCTLRQGIQEGHMFQ